MQLKGFQNVKDQLGFCGIWCGSCAAGNGAILELTRRYENMVRDYGLEKWAPKGFDFKEFTKGLTIIQTMSLCLGCKKNGGNPTCKIRNCAMEKQVVDCSRCDTITECRNFDELEKSHPRIRRELMEIKNKDRKKLIEEWTGELKTKWPHCVLLCDSDTK